MLLKALIAFDGIDRVTTKNVLITFDSTKYVSKDIMAGQDPRPFLHNNQGKQAVPYSQTGEASEKPGIVTILCPLVCILRH